MASFRVDIGLFALAVCASVLMGPGAPIYWDSFGYVTQALSGQVGGLLLGRPTFILVSHAIASIARASGQSPFALESLLRHVWLLVAALGAPATARLARNLQLGRSAAGWAGAVTALSPALAHSSDAVLTDAPSMAVTVIALALGARAVNLQRSTTALAAGVALGVAAGLREQAVFSALPLVLLLCTAPRPARLRLCVCALAGAALSAGIPVGYLLATQHGYPSTVARWLRAMSDERAHYDHRVRDLGWYVLWVLSLGPLPVALAGVTVARWMSGTGSGASRGPLAVCVPALAQLALLGAYQDIAFSPRYLVAALPCAVALPAGVAFAHCPRGARWAVVLTLVLPLVLGAWALRVRQAPLLDALHGLPARLRAVPADAAVVTGQLCPAVVYFRTLAHADPSRWTHDASASLPAWQQVCPGWRWPADLATTLDGVTAQGRTVVVDLRAVAWVGPRQQQALAQARAYGLNHQGDPHVVLWRDP